MPGIEGGVPLFVPGQDEQGESSLLLNQQEMCDNSRHTPKENACSYTFDRR